ncbi:MAG: UDP-3-O-acyl-N-acetylglucosamine deacetylase [Alphaproteobacteria bacterium]|nr:UDP-3-O-acyl-N-acetylglucosamine deacetylase [Alphaproteobacteria bacterium]
MGTLKKVVKISGVGIHSGNTVKMVVKPSKNKGIVFCRTDINSEPIVASFDNVGETKMRNTTIGDIGGAHVQTIEHLMAAFFITGIDSAIVEIDGPETPILDGSAYEFIHAFIDAGITSSKLKQIIVKKEIIAKSSDIKVPFLIKAKYCILNKLAGRKTSGYVKLSPNNGKELNISATLIYPEKIVGNQSFSYKYNGTKKSQKDFIDNVARARTFGKYSEWEYLKKHGMGRGANEHNVIALNNDGDGTLNPVLWKNEFVRHKIVDLVGDMFTSGGIINANIVSYKGSHALNNLVLRKLFSDPENYEIIE